MSDVLAPLRVRILADGSFVEVLDDGSTRPFEGPELDPKRPDANGLVDVKAIRARLGLSQRGFAERFGLSLRTLQDWEQGRYAPDTATTVLLRVIAHNPSAVISALEAA